MNEFLNTTFDEIDNIFLTNSSFEDCVKIGYADDYEVMISIVDELINIDELVKQTIKTKQ